MKKSFFLFSEWKLSLHSGLHGLSETSETWYSKNGIKMTGRCEVNLSKIKCWFWTSVINLEWSFCLQNNSFHSVIWLNESDCGWKWSSTRSHLMLKFEGECRKFRKFHNFCCSVGRALINGNWCHIYYVQIANWLDMYGNFGSLSNFIQILAMPLFGRISRFWAQIQSHDTPSPQFMGGICLYDRFQQII